MKITLFVNSEKTFFWHRKSLADHLHSLGHEVLIISSTDGDWSRFHELPYRVILVPFSRKGRNPFNEMILFFRLVRIFWRERPEVAHNFTVKCVIYGSVAQKIVGVPKIINSITGLGYAFIKGGLIQLLVEWMYRCAFLFSQSSVIFQNDSDYDFFVNKGISASEKSSIINGSGVDTDYFKPSGNGIKTNVISILFAGRLLRSKGLGELIQASSILLKEGVAHQLLVVGDLDDENPDSFTKEEIDEINEAHSHISFLGAVRDMRPIYERADVACLPSYREGLSKFLIEAASSGLPLVTTDAPGCRDVALEGNGLTVPKRSIIALGEKLRWLIEHPESRIEFGRKSRELALCRFDEKIILGKMLQIYNKNQ